MIRLGEIMNMLNDHGQTFVWITDGEDLRELVFMKDWYAGSCRWPETAVVRRIDFVGGNVLEVW